MRIRDFRADDSPEINLIPLIDVVLCLIIFFVAPFFAVLFALANFVLHREREIPYGPFLCLGALAVLLKWPEFWDATFDVFLAGWLVPAMIGICFVLMALLLWLYTLLLRITGRA